MSPTEFYTKEERKVNGVFYTPAFLAEYLGKKALQYYGDQRKLNNILDPACGDSILLRRVCEEILKKSPKQLPKVIGIDKDINAIASSSSKFSAKNLKKFNNRFIEADALFPIDEQSSDIGWLALRKDLKCDNGLDLIVSNPPWGAELNAYSTQLLSSNFDLAKGQFDVFDLFTEVILNNLSEKGIYGLILPDSVFSQEQSRFRCLLSKNTTIHLIARLGEKIFPEINRACVIIIGEKSKANATHQVDCFRLSSDYKRQVIAKELSLEQVERELLHKVPQSRFYENDSCIFDIDLKTEEIKTFDKIQKNSTLIRNFVTNTRGAEISKKGVVCQCPKCKHWFPNPKSKNPRCSNCDTLLVISSILKEKIILNHNGTGNLKLKVGEDLFRFTSFSKSWINTLKEGINYKDLSIYKGHKILVRKTGIGITASIDYDESITTQVVFILKLKPEFENSLSLEFILAVLNSRIMTYFLIKKFGENEWRSHPYLTQTILINLPFPKIDLNSNTVREIVNQVTEIVRNEVIESSARNISIQNDLIIERIIADFFRLDQSDYKIIFETLNSAQQLIPIKRLLNCTTKDIFTKNGI